MCFPAMQEATAMTLRAAASGTQSCLLSAAPAAVATVDLLSPSPLQRAPPSKPSRCACAALHVRAAKGTRETWRKPVLGPQ